MTRAPAPFPLERLADIPERPEDMSPLLSLVWLRCFTAPLLSGLCRLLM
ncbi:DNA polymerase III epsilon subunit-like 3'-5' exonuclease [Vibrio cholerae]|nr:DNA polymerase III epsilon subunit-like 3'-5' exonuclease [Vibrio cholerae]